MDKSHILLILFTISVLPLATRTSAQWVQTNLNVEGSGPLVSNDTTVYYSGFAIYSSKDNGISWTNLTDLNSGFRGPLFSFRSNLFAVGGDSGYIYHSNDYGFLWDSTCLGLPPNSIHVNGYIGAIAGTPANLFAGGRGVFHSTDSGSMWADVSTNLPVNMYVYGIAVLGSDVFVGTQDSGIFRSKDSGKSWVTCNNGLVARKYFPGSYLVLSLASLGTYLFAGTIGEDEDTSYGVFRSKDSGRSWQHSSVGLTYFDSVSEFATEGTRIFAALDQGGVYESSDSGQTWVSYNDWPAFSGPHLARSITATYQSVFVGTYLNGVWQRPLSDFGRSSVAPTQSESSVLIYPNPSNGLVTITCATGQVSVTNVLGLQVLSTEYRLPNTGEISLDLSRLPAGTYFVRVATEGGFVTRKILKE